MNCSARRWLSPRFSPPRYCGPRYAAICGVFSPRGTQRTAKYVSAPLMLKNATSHNISRASQRDAVRNASYHPVVNTKQLEIGVFA